MSIPLIGLVTAIYMIVAVSLWMDGNIGMSVCFAGYSLANAGLIFSMMQPS